jgi:hypothetical protein
MMFLQTACLSQLAEFLFFGTPVKWIDYTRFILGYIFVGSQNDHPRI